MKPLTQKLRSFYVVLSIIGLQTAAFGIVSTDQKHYTQKDLPIGGQYVHSPKEDKTRYYHVESASISAHRENFQKLRGLFKSMDGGATWELRCDCFDFNLLYVHPTTGALFSVITSQPLESGRDGFLVRRSLQKILMSIDGSRWKDITGPRMPINEISRIFQDPYHPTRVCLEGSGIRLYTLQANDDQYTNWTGYQQSDWEARLEMTPPPHTIQTDAIWKGLWNAASEPAIESMTDKEASKYLVGQWTCTFGPTADELVLTISADYRAALAGVKEARPWQKTGEWKVSSGKLVIFLPNETIPSFIFRLKDDFYLFDPWAKTMMTPLNRVK